MLLIRQAQDGGSYGSEGSGEDVEGEDAVQAAVGGPPALGGVVSELPHEKFDFLEAFCRRRCVLFDLGCLFFFLGLWLMMEGVLDDVGDVGVEKPLSVVFNGVIEEQSAIPRFRVVCIENKAGALGCDGVDDDGEAAGFVDVGDVGRWRGALVFLNGFESLLFFFGSRGLNFLELLELGVAEDGDHDVGFIDGAVATFLIGGHSFRVRLCAFFRDELDFSKCLG